MSANIETERIVVPSVINKISLLGIKSSAPTLVLAGLIFLAMLVRLDDMTDLPLDFHPTRQLWSALIARGMYYQDSPSVPEWKRQMAVMQWKGKSVLEPRVMETLAAAGYRVLGEDALWVPRLFSILFWVLAAIPLYLLSRDLSGAAGGLVATGLYLFLPYAVIASRSFQPEPILISAMIFALWALFRWFQSPSWGRALLAGILLCLAIFVKAIILFPLLGGMAGLLLFGWGFKRTLRNPQVWLIVVITLLPYIVYFFYGTYVGRFLQGNLSGRFFPELLISPWFYIRWELKINQVMTHLVLALALIGIFFHSKPAQRGLVIGLWLGYVAYGVLFNYQISTHDYYHLPLVPIAVLSLAPLVEKISSFVTLSGKRLSASRSIRHLPGLGLIVVILAILGGMIWRTYQTLHAVDYRGEVIKYARIQNELGRKKKVIALTEDYGYRLAYWGWVNARIWPSYGDLVYMQKLRKSDSAEFRKTFSSLTAGMDYFLVTWFDELEYQPELKDYLFQNYPILQQDGGYLIFDLKHPLTQTGAHP